MKLRSGRTTVATPPSSFGDVDGDGDDMNASLWGELQRFIDLSLIYAKLPLAPFFRLRQVCKEWNRLASDRQFLEQHFQPPISKLYFVVARTLGHHLWTSSSQADSSSSWASSPLPRSDCEVSGLLLLSKDSDRNRVFDLHTRVFYSLPRLPPSLPLPRGMKKGHRTTVGMTVDTTLIPYEFRVFIKDDCGTWIYDSNSGAWERRRSFSGGPALSTRSSIHYNNFLYIFGKNPFFSAYFFVDMYDLEKYVWTFTFFRCGTTMEWEYGGIGVWRDRFFAFGMTPKSVLTVWQMNTHFGEWTVFDSMPKDLHTWMMRDLGHQNLLSTFYGDHVLVYNCLEVEERAVLYNLDRKTWDKIELLGNSGRRLRKKSARSKIRPLNCSTI